MIKLDMAEKLWETLESILIDDKKGFISVNGGKWARRLQSLSTMESSSQRLSALKILSGI